MESEKTPRGRAAPGWVVPVSKTPLKSPLVQGGTLFSSNGMPHGGMRGSLILRQGQGLYTGLAEGRL